MAAKTLKSIVKNLPGSSGWFDPSNSEAWLMLAQHLDECGETLADIESLLTDAFNAVRDEYGA